MLMRWASALMILLYTELAISAPLDYFPINSQLPPVAYISEPFSFVFSPLTFSSPFPISYSLVDPPGWLSINSDSRTLFGTPTEDDIMPGLVVGVPISIVATDEEGSTTVSATLVVSRNPTPRVEIPLSEQAHNLGSFSTPSSIVLYQSRNFSFSFDSTTFSPPGLNYYAVSGNNTPLPSWINFDADSMSFSGRTPSVDSSLQPPQMFALQLAASDVAGFSSVSVYFSIIIGIHELTAETPYVVLNATHESSVEYDDLSKILKLDSETLDRSNVSSITTAGLPDWLSFDPETWEFKGTPGVTANSTNATVSVVDIYSDTLNVTLVVRFETGLFTAELPTTNISSGTDLVFDLKPYLRNPADVELSVEDESEASWIRLDSSTLELLGKVPVSTTASNVEIRLEAKSRSSQQTESRNFSMIIDAGKSTVSNSSSLSYSTTDSTTSTPTATASSTPKSSAPVYSMTRILLAILVPLILFCMIGLILLICCWRKRRRNREHEHVLEVSAPIPGTFIKHDASSLKESALPGMFETETALSRSSSNSSSLAPAAFYRIRTTSNPSIQSSNAPSNTMSFYAFDYRRPLSDSMVRETRESWLAGQHFNNLSSPRTEVADDVSVLSRTSIVSGNHENQGTTHALVTNGTRAQSFRRSLVTSPVPGMGVPVFNERPSIQATPEVAYIAGGNDSDDEARPGSPTDLESVYSGDAGLGIQPPEKSAARTTSVRVSNAWKRASPARLLEEYKRTSNISTPAAETTPTDLLTDEATNDPATANIISRPTVVHVPSRLGESRRTSRQLDKSIVLSGEGSTSTTKAPHDFNATKDRSSDVSSDEWTEPPLSIPYDTTVAGDSDPSWDRSSRNTLGLAYKDIVKSSRESIKSIVAARKSQSSLRRSSSKNTRDTRENEGLAAWDDRLSKDVMSPDQWPRPHTADGAVAPRPSSSEAPPPIAARHRRGVSHEERQRFGRLREQQALDAFKAMVSKADSAEPPPDPSPRPLPEMPVRTARTPLADKPNDPNSVGGGLRNKGKGSHNRSKSVSLTKMDYAGADNGWEDVRSDSTPGAERIGSSTGSLTAFI